jgi:hypothetical protein
MSSAHAPKIEKKLLSPLVFYTVQMICTTDCASIVYYFITYYYYYTTPIPPALRIPIDFFAGESPGCHADFLDLDDGFESSTMNSPSVAVSAHASIPLSAIIFEPSPMTPLHLVRNQSIQTLCVLK